MKVYITSEPTNNPNAVVSDRYWVVDEDKKKIYHRGVCDIDFSFIQLLLNTLDVQLFEFRISDDEFKKLFLSLGYEAA